MLKEMAIGCWLGLQAGVWIIASSAILVRLAYWIADRPITGPLF